jgi:hypothetical protein
MNWALIAVAFVPAIFWLEFILLSYGDVYAYSKPVEFKIQEHIAKQNDNVYKGFHSESAHLIGLVYPTSTSTLNIDSCLDNKNRIGIEINHWKSFEGYSDIPSEMAIEKMKKEYPIDSIIRVWIKQDCSRGITYRYGLFESYTAKVTNIIYGSYLVIVFLIFGLSAMCDSSISKSSIVSNANTNGKKSI